MADRAAKVQLLDLAPRYGNGAVPTGSYTMLVPNNPKRRWFAVTVPTTEADPMLLVLSNGEPAIPTFAQIYVAPGVTVILSMSGDMPWQGPVYATGYLADSYCFWSEVEDYP